jgi:hypothetical protein
VPPDSALIGRQIAKMGLPADAHALLVRRYDGYFLATGGTRLRRDDVLVVMASDDAHDGLAELGLERVAGPASVCSLPAPDGARPRGSTPAGGAGRVSQGDGRGDRAPNGVT